LTHAAEGGIDCRDPRLAVQTNETRALDLLGLKPLRDLMPEQAVCRLWQLHQEDE
jgi:hypothetical protein